LATPPTDMAGHSIQRQKQLSRLAIIIIVILFAAVLVRQLFSKATLRDQHPRARSPHTLIQGRWKDVRRHWAYLLFLTPSTNRLLFCPRQHHIAQESSPRALISVGSVLKQTFGVRTGFTSLLT